MERRAFLKQAAITAATAPQHERGHPDDTKTNIPAVPTRDFHDFLPVFVAATIIHQMRSIGFRQALRMALDGAAN